MKLTFIEFKDTILNLSNNGIATQVEYSYDNINYQLLFYQKGECLQVYAPGRLLSKIAVNYIIKGEPHDIVFAQQNLKDEKDLNQTTLLTKYQLTIIKY